MKTSKTSSLVARVMSFALLLSTYNAYGDVETPLDTAARDASIYNFYGTTAHGMCTMNHPTHAYKVHYIITGNGDVLHHGDFTVSQQGGLVDVQRDGVTGKVGYILSIVPISGSQLMVGFISRSIAIRELGRVLKYHTISIKETESLQSGKISIVHKLYGVIYKVVITK